MIKFEASQGNKRLSDYRELRHYTWQFFDIRRPTGKPDLSRQSMLWEHE